MSMQRKSRASFLFLVVCLLYAADRAEAEPAYDPLAVAPGFEPRTVDLAVHDGKRERELPVKVYLPAETGPVPVVLFSHGLGGSREGNAYLGRHWAARGYVAVFLQHLGSDAAVWQDTSPVQRMAAMERAANRENFMLRVEDVHVVLDQLERWQASADSPLAGRLDLRRIGMSGHSFGARTTQAVSGQHFRLGYAPADPRIGAAILFSPSSPRRGDPQQAFGEVGIPWLLMTGTQDVAPIGDTDVESRLAVFNHLPPGGKYELVLYGAEHSAFSDRPLPGDAGARNPNHHRVIQALSTAFWDAYLRGNGAAMDWLDGQGPRSLLDSKDGWRAK